MRARGDTGSVVMFAIPPGSGERALDESFLQSIDAGALLRQWNASAADLVQAGVACLRKRVAQLADLVQSGRVKVPL